MGGKIQVEISGKRSRTGRANKSGCRTCKIRRIKCDESKPACHRCVSTGRTCDGYGIWGGGGNAHGQHSISPKDCNAVPKNSVPVLTLAKSTEEKGYFDWFMCRTNTKLPGIFGSSFWDTLVLQASLDEPAVLHAVLALSSVHKRDAIDDKRQREKGTILDEQEQFMLQQYSKAISHLQPRFLANNKASVHVALVACVVFICLELLRGRYRTAQAHLHNGLKLLRETQARESIDSFIIDAFLRLHVQVQLLSRPSQHPFLVMLAPEPELPAVIFHSMSQARQHLERLLEEIFHLTEQARQQGIPNLVGYGLELIDHQRCIRAKLASWLATYKASRANLLAQLPVRGPFAYELLLIYHTMTDIMAHACLWPPCEWIYDSHANDFVYIIIQSIHLWKTSPSIAEADNCHGIDVSRSIVDVGWIPPLYYTALKCRNHRVRLQAIKLLDSTSHREGIWDAKIAACIARKVVEIEERDFYKEMYMADDFNFCSAPEERDFLLPALPDSYRIHEVQVVLSDDSMGKIVLLCRQRQVDGSWEDLVREYDMLSACWRDIDGRK